MNTSMPAPRESRLRQAALALFMACATFLGAASAQVEVAQSPLYVGVQVPGNLVLTPSVEWPTINSVANLGAYSSASTYVGYFDAGKCYDYHYEATEANRHFYPVSSTSDHTCTGKQWSGNYMNWAATQTIDPFRLALTGGNRVRDTPTTTWLEKARHTGQGGTNVFPNREVSNSAVVEAATPAYSSWDGIRTRIQGLGSKMYFARSDIGRSGNKPTVGNPRGDLVAYNPAVHDLDGIDQTGDGDDDEEEDEEDEEDEEEDGNRPDRTIYEVSIRVEVCKAGLLEANCKQYSQGWKPEGLIQEYSDRIRYSIFGYLNDPRIARDGAVLRSQQKFVGPKLYKPAQDPADNTLKEWDPVTGVLDPNPNPAEAAATAADGIADSGVINYLNKFGQMTSENHKQYDPVSEMYYIALRYLKHMGNVAAYSKLANSGSNNTPYDLADGFPVITDWDDPIEYRCQANVILGIGDVNTHRDKNLPGATSGSEEPTKPAEVVNDTTVDVVKAWNKIAALEGISAGPLDSFSGRKNSAYIAALAYLAHTTDIRPDLEDDQMVDTYWVDVREAQVLEPRAQNQYLLAAKYGGFDVPDGYDPYARTEPLPESWWHDSDDILSTGDKRPDNFYVASEAGKMVESLRRAFESIVASLSGSGSSLASNSTHLESGAFSYQAKFFSDGWYGELAAYAVDPDTGNLANTATWSASEQLPVWDERKIYVNGDSYGMFTWDNLSGAQQTVLGNEDTVDFLRGERANEDGDEFRERSGVLGDIVHSGPVYVGAPNARLYYGASFLGADSYVQFAVDHAARTPVLYVGANDGMLHGFNALTGEEIYAFVPAAAINAELASYTQPDYEHHYFVDGQTTVADVYSGGAWKTVLVGTMGRGGKSVFALDVTDPASVKFLWERDASDIAALGNTIGKPIIAQVAAGDWRVLIGNGPNSADDTAQLVMIDVDSGASSVISTGVAGDNGLSGVDAWDSDRDGYFDTVYAGDMQGNMWRFSNVAGTGTAAKLFVATDPDGTVQPITSAPLIGLDPTGQELWIFFGTGRYLGEGDLTDKQVQTWYGIIDNGSMISGRTQLAPVSIIYEGVLAGEPVRATSEILPTDLSGKRGWYMDLVSPNNGAEGERMVITNRFERGALIGTTRIPDSSDVCSPSGRGYIMALNPFTGSRPSRSFFDVNRDGSVDGGDTVEIDGENVAVTGIGFESSPNGPIFHDDKMQVVLQNGDTETIGTGVMSTDVGRTTWRELLRQ